jgi:hypothetical protein
MEIAERFQPKEDIYKVDFLQEMPGYMWVLIASFLGLSIFLTILWIIVPFSIFGVKSLLKDMLYRLELIEKHLYKTSLNNPLKTDEFPGEKGEETPSIPK